MKANVLIGGGTYLRMKDQPFALAPAIMCTQHGGRQEKQMQIRLIVGTLSLVALVGCGSSESSTPETTTSLKSTTTVAVTTPPTTVATTTTTVRVTTTMGSTSKGLMPSVVGMNLQAAQDLIQSKAGVFYSRSFDCTGQGRNQVIDSNWVVVTQTPSPGSAISEGTANLGVVKTGESRSC